MESRGFQRAWICALTAAFWMSQYLYFPFLTPYLLSLGLSATLVGFIVGAYGLTQLLLRIPLGITVDRVGHHHRFILAGALLAALSSAIMRLYPTPGMLFLANALSGVASSTWISFAILFAGHHEALEQTKALGVLNAFYSLGILLAFLVGGLVASRSGVRLLFLLSALAGGITSLMALFLTWKPSGEPRTRRPKGLGETFKSSRMIFHSLLGAATFLVLFGTVLSFTNSVARHRGASGTMIGFFAMLYSLGCVLGSFLLTLRRVQRIREGHWLALGFGILAIYCASVPLVPDLAWFYPLHLLCGLGSGALTGSLMAFAVKGASPERRTAAMGFYQSINCLGTTLGPVVMGFLLDHGSPRSAFLSMGGAGLVCAALALWVGRDGTTVGGLARG